MRIIHPEPGFTGSASGIEFTGGEALIESISGDAQAVLLANGFSIDGVTAPAPADPEDPPIVGEPADGEQITDENAAIVEHEDGAVEVGTITERAPAPAKKRSSK